MKSKNSKTIENIRIKISLGQLNEALQEADIIFSKTIYRNEYITLLSRHSKLNKDLRIGVLSYGGEPHRANENLITYTLLLLLEKVEFEKIQESPKIRQTRIGVLEYIAAGYILKDTIQNQPEEIWRQKLFAKNENINTKEESTNRDLTKIDAKLILNIINKKIKIAEAKYTKINKKFNFIQKLLFFATGYSLGIKPFDQDLTETLKRIDILEDAYSKSNENIDTDDPASFQHDEDIYNDSEYDDNIDI